MSAKSSKKIGLALAGGGMAGACYEIGALKALEDAIEGLNFNEDISVYVGVSAGSVIGALLVNGFTTADLCRNVIHSDGDEPVFSPERFFQPALGQYMKSAYRIPQILYQAFQEYIETPKESSISKLVTRLSRSLPPGIFDNEPIRRYLEEIFSIKGRTNDFRRLKKPLYVVATDLDSGSAAVFGQAGRDHIPISQAIQASTAFPGIYPPVTIEGRHYLDGVLLRTLHASTLLQDGMDLVFCINPIVPVDTARSVEMGIMKRGKLVDRGMPIILAQTFRTLIHSRLVVGLAAYETKFKGADVLLFEPNRDDYRMFFTNIFGYKSRQHICEHAYETTLKNLAQRKDMLSESFERHGLRIRPEVLHRSAYDLWKSVGLDIKGLKQEPVTSRLDNALARLESLLEQ